MSIPGTRTLATHSAAATTAIRTTANINPIVDPFSTLLIAVEPQSTNACATSARSRGRIG